jgi:hypothetical protein
VKVNPERLANLGKRATSMRVSFIVRDATEFLSGSELSLPTDGSAASATLKGGGGLANRAMRRIRRQVVADWRISSFQVLARDSKRAIRRFAT